MKTQLFGKTVEIRTEAVVILISILVLLGCLMGYIFFSDNSDIIIEADKGKPAENAAAGKASDVRGVNGAEPNAGTDTSALTGKAEVKLTSGQAGAATDIDKAGAAADIPGNTGGPKEMIKVYVVGCVKNPGIVTIEKGRMIDDAVTAAGGLTEEADSENINMVYALNENVMLHIESKKERIASAAAGNSGAATGGTAVKSSTAATGGSAIIAGGSGSGALIIGEGEDSGETAGGENVTQKVNINTADMDELDTLPGVGEATARDIIACRDKLGGFRKIEDIMKVPRIKQNRFESIKDYITVN